mgnify:CR=1 FL=1
MRRQLCTPSDLQTPHGRMEKYSKKILMINWWIKGECSHRFLTPKYNYSEEFCASHRELVTECTSSCHNHLRWPPFNCFRYISMFITMLLKGKYGWMRQRSSENNSRVLSKSLSTTNQSSPRYLELFCFHIKCTKARHYLSWRLVKGA